MARDLQMVDVGSASIDAYAAIAGPEAIEELRSLAEPLRGRRVLYVNATSFGGGVSELLRSVVPLLRDLGVDAHWAVMFGEPDFYDVTKALHNSLQGGEFAVSDEDWSEYLRCNERNADALSPSEYDTIIVNDPQPAALAGYAPRNGCDWIWRSHIDTSEPDPVAWELLAPFIEQYDAHVFSMPQFVPNGIAAGGVHIIPPAIDPLSPKNMGIPWSVAGAVLRWIGIDLTRPLVCQVSRFDPWKDPLGTIEAWRLAREEVEGLQLAMVGSMAGDDPEGWRVYHEITEYAEADEALHVFTNYTGVGNIEVNAFQRLARCVVQKSIREGFGLVVSESLFKGTPVVAGNAGGIPAQLRDGRDGYLVSSIEECAGRIVELVRDPGLAVELGRSGRDHVRSRFLVTRLLADEMRMIATPARAETPAGAH